MPVTTLQCLLLLNMLVNMQDQAVLALRSCSSSMVGVKRVHMTCSEGWGFNSYRYVSINSGRSFWQIASADL
jgi:hypothetical protein